MESTTTPFVLSPKFFDAASYAARLHAKQLRKTSGAPYFAHLIGTAAIVLEYKGTEEEATAALLHDAVEDQGGPPVLDEIRKLFGDRIADLVNLCTMRKSYKGASDDQYEEERIKSQDAYVLQLAGDRSAMLIGLCDKIYNARSLLMDIPRIGNEAVWAPFRGGAPLAIKLFERVGAGLGVKSWVRETAPLWELDYLVSELKRLSASAEYWKQKPELQKGAASYP